MTETYYTCPECGRPSSSMNLSPTKRNVTQDDLNNSFGHIANEILLCDCGKELSWFDMVEITLEQFTNGLL